SEEISVSSLQDTISKFFRNRYLFNRDQIRKAAVHKYSQEIQAKAYISLFEKIFNRKKES
ncbi:MAG: hypothetical protein WCD31_03035, partial [Gillisia sp.]